jgi:hypothetical protein
MGNEKETREPIRQSIHVDCPVEDAFRLFTERFTEWWPGDDADHAAIERGSVTIWDPPGRIEFTWDRDDRQTVTADFRVETDGTRLTLTHSGWRHAAVLSNFAGFVARQALVAV